MPAEAVVLSVAGRAFLLSLGAVALVAVAFLLIEVAYLLACAIFMARESEKAGRRGRGAARPAVR